MSSTIEELYRTKRALGVWHATRIFQQAGWSGEHGPRAADAVHNAVVRLLRKGPRCDAPIFLRAVRAAAWNAVRDGRPIEMVYEPAPGSRRARLTGTFPNQIFGCALADAFAPAPAEEAA